LERIAWLGGPVTPELTPIQIIRNKLVVNSKKRLTRWISKLVSTSIFPVFVEANLGLLFCSKFPTQHFTRFLDQESIKARKVKKDVSDHEKRIGEEMLVFVVENLQLQGSCLHARFLARKTSLGRASTHPT
jgi:hypothetical protein